MTHRETVISSPGDVLAIVGDGHAVEQSPSCGDNVSSGQSIDIPDSHIPPQVECGEPALVSTDRHRMEGTVTRRISLEITTDGAAESNRLVSARGNERPVVFQGADAGHYSCVILPCRLDLFILDIPFHNLPIAQANFDVLIACAFNFEAHTTEFNKLGRIPVLKARMNADLHMSDDLKNTGKGNLFVIFGEPDITLLPAGDQVQVKVNGVDVFHPSTGEVRSSNTDQIACWFIDTDFHREAPPFSTGLNN